MYSAIVLVILFFVALAIIWFLMINANIHGKLAKKAEKFKQTNFNNEEENV